MRVVLTSELNSSYLLQLLSLFFEKPIYIVFLVDYPLRDQLLLFHTGPPLLSDC
jgi:hypothetical protein